MYIQTTVRAHELRAGDAIVGAGVTVVSVAPQAHGWVAVSTGRAASHYRPNERVRVAREVRS